MKQLLLRLYEFFGKIYLRPIFELEQGDRTGRIVNERPAEYAFAFRHLRDRCTGTLLDVGPGKSSWPHLLSTCGYDVTAIDKMDGYWSRYFNRHFRVINDDITQPKSKERYQFITCMSVLEHIPNHRIAISNIHDLLDPGGYLILTFPYNEAHYHENIYKHPDAGYGQNANFVTQVFSRSEVNEWLAETSFTILDQEYYQAFTGPLWTMGKRINPCRKVEVDELHHMTCIILQRS